MGHSDNTSVAKKRTNLSVNTALLEEAKALGINLSQSAEKGIAEAIKHYKHRFWQEENADAIASSNAYVEERGLPLAKYRQF